MSQLCSDHVQIPPSDSPSRARRPARTLQRIFLRFAAPWQTPWRSYAFAAGVLGIAFLLRFALDPWLAQGQGLALLMLAPFTITLVAGLAPGVFAGLVSFFGAWYFFLGPFGGFALSADDGATLAVYAAASVICVAVSDTLRNKVARLETEITKSERLAEHLAVLIEAVPRGILSMDSQGRIRTLNDRLADEFGYRREELLDRPFEMLLPPRFRSDYLQPHAGELSGLRKDGSEFPVEILFSPFSWDDTRMMLASVADITERKRAEERERLLKCELQHRSKNLFAKVQALAVGTLRGDSSIDEARETFLDRLSWLARADQWLTAYGPGGARLGEVVRSELAHFGDRITIEGTEVALAPQVAQNVALALHELATNAAKYGALSCPDGRVTVRWSVSNADESTSVRMRWREEGGPPVRPPTRRGFGTTLLGAALASGRIDYAPEGLTYEAELRV